MNTPSIDLRKKRRESAWRARLRSAKFVLKTWRDGWQRQPEWRKKFFFNVLFGLAIELACLALRHTPLLVSAENAASDLAMNVHAIIHSTPPRLPLTFIAVDEETWRSTIWGGGPYYAPRARLFELLKDAADRHPRFIVLDVEVEEPTVPDDKQFLDHLSALPTDVDYIFVRSIRQPLYQSSSEAGLTAALQKSPLDAFLASHDNFHIAAPYFQASRDGVVRSWRLSTVACQLQNESDHHGNLVVVPSVQLLVATLSAPGVGNASAARQRARRLLEGGGACATDLDGLGASDPGAPERLERAFQQRLSSSKVLDHIPRGENVEDEELESKIWFKYRASANDQTISIIPALFILKTGNITPTGKLELARLDLQMAGGVVLIGQSFQAAGDVHPTPLGLMPGGLIILNSVGSILDPGLIRAPGWPLETFLMLVTILAAAFAFAKANSIRANFMMVAATIAILPLVCIFMLQQGYWLDFAVPLIGLALHRTVAEIEEYVSESHERTKAKLEHHSEPSSEQ